MCSLQFKPAHLNIFEARSRAQVCRRRWSIKWTICQQNSRDLGARVIKYPAADHHTPEKRFARLPQSAEQAKADSNSFPPTVTQPKHSKRSQCKPEAISLQKIWVTSNPHHAGYCTFISATRANATPWDRLNNKVIGQEHRSVRPAIMFIREPSRPLDTRDRAANASGRHVAIKNQIARAAFAKIRFVPEGTNTIWKNGNGDLADVENRIWVNNFLRQSTPAHSWKAFVKPSPVLSS